VPWLPLPATHPQIAKVTIPAVPDPSVAAAAPPCRADQLRVVSNGPGGAGGTDYLLLQVFGRGTEACRLSGTPAVQAMYRGRPADVPVRKLRPDSSTYLGPVLVTATHPAWLRLAWGSMWCARPVATDTVRVTLPGSAGAFSAPGFRGTPYCNGDPGTHVREPIMVGPFQPQHFRLSRIRSPYSPVEAGDYNGVTRVVGSGREVRFAVTLTSKRDVVLDPCPDYTIGVLSLAHTRTYALNCAQVPYKDARGRAYLPAGKPVTFAMRATAPDHPAAGKLSWVLDTPDRTVLAVGALTVKGHG
jgi:hypothetical protein